MEPSSGNRRRGRPRAFAEPELSEADGRSALSHRHRQNRAFARQARRRLAELWWREELPEDLFVPQCVLMELGRIRDNAKFGEAAWWYVFSAGGLAAKQAAVKIKQMRMGNVRQEGPMTLYKRLVKTVKDFQVDYPNASFHHVEGQLNLALQTISNLRQYRP
jgi:hypothetical protein